MRAVNLAEMPGHAPEEPFTDGPFHFTRATAADAEEINRILADNPMAGRIEVSLEHAPDPLASDFGLSNNHVGFLARHRDDPRAIGYGERTTWRAFVDGEERHLPYLAALRVARDYRNRIRLLRGAFAALRREAERPGDVPFALTSIARDNLVARRVLTAGITGLPTYSELADFVTLFLRAKPTHPDPGIFQATPEDLPRIAAFLNRANAQRNLAPVWSVQSLRTLEASGLRAEHFLLAEEAGELIGCLAVWDQSSRRQAVIRGYRGPLAWARPALNALAPLTRLPTLPPVGARIRQACLSHLAIAEPDHALLERLIAQARGMAQRRGLSALFLGLPASDPSVARLRKRLRAVQYRTTLFGVHWPDVPPPSLDPHLPIHPEAGLM